ncbi:hypothetical protein [Bacillus sp. BB56-3]|uniref:hypothetical protein n=1 Tax=Bacillus sp. BB56-3 TaxID=2217831 RepID=UPI0011EE9B6A|nr:hypothetical protein [Bacillus sp. BB56-3]KAA0801945.1 hypothetical protein DN406_02535 [Bacillus sp. BB56-3]HDR8143812.1 hypothetical protein [Bacillus cereus]
MKKELKIQSRAKTKFGKETFKHAIIKPGTLTADNGTKLADIGPKDIWFGDQGTFVGRFDITSLGYEVNNPGAPHVIYTLLDKDENELAKYDAGELDCSCDDVKKENYHKTQLDPAIYEPLDDIVVDISGEWVECP